jgi:hypothetical protein
MVEKVLNHLRSDGISDIGQTAQKLLEEAKSSVLAIMQAAIEQMDMALVAANKERRKDGLRIKERDVPRRILTDLGEICYKRTYFETAQGERRYLLDHLIGVEAYERLSKELCAGLVQRAADGSMGKAAKVMNAVVSRQTVNNKVLALKEVAAEAVKHDETPKELHIFADEDHVHMKSGRSAIVPLVTVTEGIDTTKKRHRTKNAIHFEGYGVKASTFFENVSSFLYESYNMERVEQIYVHGDGGQWIYGIKDWLPKVKFVMDGFHLEKRMRQIGRLSGAGVHMGALRKAIRADSFEGFIACCLSIQEKLDEAAREKFTEHVNFLQNHWDAVVLRLQKEVCGSCTEPLVGHVLSARLSRNPLAWSEHGLRQMAMLRVYVKNGGVVSGKDIRISRSKADLERDRESRESGYVKYRNYTDKQMDDFARTPFDWSVFDKPQHRLGKLDGTTVLLKAYGKMRNVFGAA